MKTRAAVAFEAKKPLEIIELDLEGPKAGEVLVEIKATGICHTDAYTLDGLDSEGIFPSILGHEGAGIVCEVGAGVTSVKPGDHVVLCWAPACGVCAPCREGRAVLCDRVERVTFRNKLPSGAARLRARGQNVAPFLGTACFSDFVIVPDAGTIPVPADVPFE